VLSLELPRLENILSPSTGLIGDVGDVGERGEREPRSKEALGDLVGGSPGETGDEGEGGGNRHSSHGLRSIFMIGGTPSTDLDLLPPKGDGDLDLLVLREQKLPLFERGIWDLLSRFTFWKFDKLEKEKSRASEDLREQELSEDTAETPEVKE
jgi:hypothetical protein